jgi:site-specific recombinase XerD
LVQRALNHADIKTTTKYAHVVDDEVAAGLDECKSPEESPESRQAKLAKLKD